MPDTRLCFVERGRRNILFISMFWFFYKIIIYTVTGKKRSAVGLILLMSQCMTLLNSRFRSVQDNLGSKMSKYSKIWNLQRIIISGTFWISRTFINWKMMWRVGHGSNFNDKGINLIWFPEVIVCPTVHIFIIHIISTLRVLNTQFFFLLKTYLCFD